jgi:hypothetical protein
MGEIIIEKRNSKGALTKYSATFTINFYPFDLLSKNTDMALRISHLSYRDRLL